MSDRAYSSAFEVLTHRGNEELKQPKKPTRAQKEAIKAAGLDPKTWNVGNVDNISMTLISKKSGRNKVIFL